LIDVFGASKKTVGLILVKKTTGLPAKLNVGESIKKKLRK
jgi:hypothetical protein